MIQQQRYGTSLFSTPGKIIGDAGIGALFGRGLMMSCGREGVFTAGMLGLGPTFGGLRPGRLPANQIIAALLARHAMARRLLDGVAGRHGRASAS